MRVSSLGYPLMMSCHQQITSQLPVDVITEPSDVISVTGPLISRLPSAA